MSPLPAVDIPPASTVEAYVIRVWSERREIAGGTVATVEAYVVPKSGVGWVDFNWHGMTAPAPAHVGRRINIKPERRRLLADWSGHEQSTIVRQVLTVVDGWFVHCTEVAEREVALIALAAEEARRPMGPTGVTGPGGIGGPTVSQGRQLTEELRRQMEQMRRAGTLPNSSALAGSTSPGAGDQAVEGVLFPFAGETSFGTPESPSDGLSDLGDYVAEPHVRR